MSLVKCNKQVFFHGEELLSPQAGGSAFVGCRLQLVPHIFIYRPYLMTVSSDTKKKSFNCMEVFSFSSTCLNTKELL
jgi:hypothetical protein